MPRNAFLWLLLWTATLWWSSANAGEKMDVEMIDRRESMSTYSYFVPGSATSRTDGRVDCSTYGSTTNCDLAATTQTYSRPSVAGSYDVRGATLSLKLPDGRIAVVNCDRKVKWNEISPGWYRSCRVPPATKFQAVFSRDKAKLRWPVSIDGKKFESETYRIVAVIEQEQRHTQAELAQ